jgi:transcription initiation factor TFIIH subunit 1
VYTTNLQALLRAEEIAQAQKPGRQPRLIDDRFGLQEKNRLGVGGTGKGLKNKEESGPQTMSLRPEDIGQIFEEFPVVADAYNKYVPGVSRRFLLSCQRLAMMLMTVVDQRSRVLAAVFPKSIVGAASRVGEEDGQ